MVKPFPLKLFYTIKQYLDGIFKAKVCWINTFYVRYLYSSNSGKLQTGWSKTGPPLSIANGANGKNIFKVAPDFLIWQNCWQQENREKKS